MFSGALGDSMKKKMMQSVTPSETAIGQNVAHILTTTEFELFVAVDRLVEAADAGEFGVPQTMEERRDEILDVADAVAAQEFERWWWEEVAPEFVDDPETAHEYVGLEPEEWQATITEWAEDYRDRAPDAVEGMTDAELAQHRVQKRHDVDLSTFAVEVVEWSAADHLQGVVRKNLMQATTRINEVAAHLEDIDDA